MDRIEIVQGDLTKQHVDAIVNAANSSLMGGGGVDGAIHRAGGPEILEACKEIIAEQGSCPTGEAVITTGGNLPARFVIHTVGPIYDPDQQEEVERLLSNAYRNSLALAARSDLQSVAFPNISTGVYRFPKRDAARIAIQTVQDFLSENDKPKLVRFVCFDTENFQLYRELLD